MQNPGSNTRSDNMARRKAQILQHARETIADEGFDALKLRALASSAGVTVPTIYNLIGGKDEILRLIIEDLVDRLQAVQQRVEVADVEEAFESQINHLAELFNSDQNYYRAAFIAGDRSGLFEQRSPSGIFARSVALPVEACKDAISANLLLGEIDPRQMGQHIYGCYRLARQDWTNGYQDIDGFRQQALSGVFLCLAADAAPAFKKRLIARLETLQ